MWAAAEKVGILSQSLDDPAFPQVTYRHGAAGSSTLVLRGSSVQVQTVVLATRQWGMTPARIAAEYDLSAALVEEALVFYEAHRAEIDAAIAAEQALETARV
jgi:uncharacterized protein (DUF433 family)